MKVPNRHFPANPPQMTTLLDVCVFVSGRAVEKLWFVSFVSWFVYNRNCRVTRTFVGFFGIQILKLFVKNLTIIPNSPINLENSNDSQYFVQRSINPIVYTYRFQLKYSQSQFFLKNHFQKNENHDINFPIVKRRAISG